jgi:hypothetical protein
VRKITFLPGAFVQHAAVELHLIVQPRQRFGDEELEFGAEQAHPVGACLVQRIEIQLQAGIQHQATSVPSFVRAGLSRRAA